MAVAWSSRTAYRIAPPVGACGAITASSFLTPRSRTGSRTGGKRRQRRIPTDYLDWALSDFSGYIAADELYDGPFCVLSIVDNRTFKRLSYHVLDHDLTKSTSRHSSAASAQRLEARGLSLKGITTDGSTMYPEPIAAVFGDGAASGLHSSTSCTSVNKAISRPWPRTASVWKPVPPNCRGAVPAQRRPSVPLGARSGSSRRWVICSRTGTCSCSGGSARLSGRRSSGSAHAGRNCAACAGHGGGLPVVRSAVPDGHSVGQAGEAAGAVAAVRPAGEGAKEATGWGWRRPWCSWTSGC